MLQRIASCFMAVLGAMSLSLAQGDLGTTPATSTPVYTPPTSSYSTPSSSSSTMAPRTGAYGVVMNGNAASDNTVLDFTRRPTLIGSQQYITGWSLGGALNSGAFSINGAGFNWFGSIVGGGAPNEVRLGMGTQQFGAGLMLSLATTDADPVGTGGTKTSAVADGYGLFGDFKLGGSSDLYLDLAYRTGWMTPVGIVNPTIDAPGFTNTNRIFHAMLGWKKDAASEGQHALNAELTLDVANKDDEFPAILAGQGLNLVLDFFHGVILKQGSAFSVFAGSSSQIRMLDLNMEAPAVDSRILNFDFMPNIGFQKTLGKGFEVFTGATVTLSYEKGENAPITGVAAVEDNWSVFTGGADASVGIRWNFENFAFEGSVSDALLTAGPNVIGGAAPGMLTQAGVSVGF